MIRMLTRCETIYGYLLVLRFTDVAKALRDQWLALYVRPVLLFPRSSQ
jgi:hypothetical protein